MLPVYLLNRFIQDSETHNIDKQFMWGSALLINPVLEQVNRVLCLFYFLNIQSIDLSCKFN